jgi:GAF domain-containing protein
MLLVLANQVGVAIRNAQLFAAQEESARVNQRLLAESETNLEEIQLLNRRLTRRAWGDYLAEKPEHFGVTATATDTREAAEWTAIMKDAIQAERIISHIESNPTVAVPIVLRGAVIGAIEIQTSGSALDEAARLAEKVSQQLAISVENARLVEEAQAIAQREQHISDIAARFQTADTVEQLLKITLSELGPPLGAKQSMIRLGRAPEPDGSSRQNGGSGQ